MPGKQGKKRTEYKDVELDKAVRAYARRMRETWQTYNEPAEGWAAPMEYKGGNGEDDLAHFDMFWSPKYWKYDRDGYQIPRGKAPHQRATGNFLSCGVVAAAVGDSRRMFTTELIYSPLAGATLTRAQWLRLIESGLFDREIAWVWLPAILRKLRLHGDESAWEVRFITGWSIHYTYLRRALDIEESAVVIDTTPEAGPQGRIVNAREYIKSLPKWKGQSIYDDITTLIFAGQRA